MPFSPRKAAARARATWCGSSIARRHHQLHARLSDLRGVDRLPGQGPPRTRGVFSPMRREMFTASRARRAVRGQVRVSKRSRWKAHRHRLPVSRRLTLARRIPGHAEVRDAPGLGSAPARPPPSTWPMWPPAARRGFWEMGLKPWDTAAGTLLITGPAVLSAPSRVRTTSRADTSSAARRSVRHWSRRWRRTSPTRK